MSRPRQNRKKKADHFTAEWLLRVQHLFAEKGWNDYNSVGMPADERINRFNTLLSKLSASERELLMTLSEDFLWVPFPEYPPHIDNALKMINAAHTHDRELVVSSIKTPDQDDCDQAKSGDLVAYSLPLQFSRHSHLKPLRRRRPLTSISAFKPDANQKYLLLLCDDYIGTGETVITALRPHLQTLFAPNVCTYVVSLIIQEQGLERIRTLGDIRFAYSFKRQRGIADSPRFPDKDAAYSVMKTIEERLDISPSYQNGYGKSEALVAVARTPDNTFPVYWCPRMAKQKKDWPAPFLRE